MDYISKLYEDISKSEELLKLKNMLESLEDNISNKKLDELDSILSCHIVGGFSNCITNSLTNIIIDMLGDLYDKDEIRVYGYYKTFEIRRAFEKINHYYYAPNSSSSPSSLLFKIDFENNQIINFDTQKEYEKAEKFLKLNIEEDKVKVEEQEKMVKKLNDYKDVGEYLLQEFSFFNIIDYIKLKFSSRRRNKFNELFIKRKEREKRYLNGIKENFNEIKQRNFINDYNELIIIKDKILDKLKPLEFEVITETTDCGDSEDIDEI